MFSASHGAGFRQQAQHANRRLILLLLRDPGDKGTISPALIRQPPEAFKALEGCPDGGAPRNDNLSRDSGRGQFEWEIRPLINPDIRRDLLNEIASQNTFSGFPPAMPPDFTRLLPIAFRAALRRPTLWNRSTGLPLAGMDDLK